MVSEKMYKLVVASKGRAAVLHQIHCLHLLLVIRRPATTCQHRPPTGDLTKAYQYSALPLSE
jgi:hypothetical protein